MIIKQPNDDYALRSFLETLESLARKRGSCWNYELWGRGFTILYFSSYIITPQALELPHLKYSQRITILSLINDIVNNDKEGAVCIVRTSSPNIFSRNIRYLQQKAIDILTRVNCYVSVYDRSQFINHAKFFIGIHFCDVNNPYWYFIAKYYGSTNFTEAGLSKGNYEEFYYRKPRMNSNLQNLSYLQKLSYYLYEIYNIMSRKNNLYTNQEFLKQYYSKHLSELKKLMKSITQAIETTSMIKLFQAYVDSQVLHLQAVSFVSDLPGRQQTSKVLQRVAAEVSPPDPLEVEALTASGEVAGMVVDTMVRELGLRKEDLREVTLKHLKATASLLGLLSEEYKPEDVRKYLNDAEKSFLDYLSEYGGAHLSTLRRICEGVPGCKRRLSEGLSG